VIMILLLKCTDYNLQKYTRSYIKNNTKCKYVSNFLGLIGDKVIVSLYRIGRHNVKDTIFGKPSDFTPITLEYFYKEGVRDANA